jgi:hypothetical protein
MSYFKETSTNMRKQALKLINQINQECKDQKMQSLAISRYDSVLSLLQITHLHIINQNKQMLCDTAEDVAEAVKEEAMAEKETTLI